MMSSFLTIESHQNFGRIEDMAASWGHGSDYAGQNRRWNMQPAQATSDKSAHVSA